MKNFNFDAIDEIQVITGGFDPEYGESLGAVFSIVTKSGGNTFQGAGWVFARHEALNARNYFQTANLLTPEYRRTQHGGMLGGPIARDRTFFFADYQGQRQRIARTVTSTVPTGRTVLEHAQQSQLLPALEGPKP